MIKRDQKKLLDTLKSVAEIFDEMDQHDWPRSEADEFYGREGICPFDFESAQAEVEGLIREIEPAIKPNNE